VAVLPYARSGIIGAFTLGLGRAVGETMAVTMVIGNRPEISLSLFAPAHTLTSLIVNEFTEAAAPMYLAALFHIALFLFGVTLLFNILARLLIYMVGWRGRNNGGW
ncbi:MAG: phosphate ABC transporter permease subunit PstC, partial [Peptococcaceae bacterium]